MDRVIRLQLEKSVQRSGRGLFKDGWSIGLREFITEKHDYTGQKFRILVEADASPVSDGPTGWSRVSRRGPPRTLSRMLGGVNCDLSRPTAFLAK